MRLDNRSAVSVVQKNETFGEESLGRAGGSGETSIKTGTLE